MANQSRGQDLRGCPSERHLLYALPQSTGPGVVSLIIGAMRDRLILIRGLFARDGRASYQIIQSWAGPAEARCSVRCAGYPGWPIEGQPIPVDTARLFLRAWPIIYCIPGNERSRNVGFVPFGTEALHRHHLRSAAPT